MKSFKLHQNWNSCNFCSKLWPKRWQVSNLTGIRNHKKLLPLLNSPPSICVEYEISSKLKHLPFSVQNYDRCQNWQVSILTGIKNYKNLVSPLSVQSTKFGLKDDRCQHWQVSRITENYCHQWIQYLQIVHYAKFRGKWLTSFPAPRFPIPIPLFKDSHFTTLEWQLKWPTQLDLLVHVEFSHDSNKSFLKKKIWRVL